MICVELGLAVINLKKLDYATYFEKLGKLRFRTTF
ncbi:MAG: hypothetical protein FD133_811 [Erysipelotrichaceae bacterium]|nr:MAG: hypothetical protein FD133_811 [Erysipelotrichaceae bacterium]